MTHTKNSLVKDKLYDIRGPNIQMFFFFPCKYKSVPTKFTSMNYFSSEYGYRRVGPWVTTDNEGL